MHLGHQQMGPKGLAPGSDAGWLGGSLGALDVSCSHCACPCPGEGREGYFSLEPRRGGRDIDPRKGLPIGPQQPPMIVKAGRHLTHRQLERESRPEERLVGCYPRHSRWKQERKGHAKTDSHRLPNSCP